MDLENRYLDEGHINVIVQIVQNMETRVSRLLAESNKMYTPDLGASGVTGTHISKEVIFSNSLEIKELIDQVMFEIESSSDTDPKPLIFKIYENNERVQSMCEDKISPERISKRDTAWLLHLEEEVFCNIDRREIHLSDLSYNLAVSKRQLNRKIQNLLHLTPNKYIRILKLHKAKQLIDEFLYDTISQISYAVGYYDTHYFSKLFCYQYGISPKQMLDEKRY